MATKTFNHGDIVSMKVYHGDGNPVVMVNAWGIGAIVFYLSRYPEKHETRKVLANCRKAYKGNLVPYESKGEVPGTGITWEFGG